MPDRILMATSPQLFSADLGFRKPSMSTQLPDFRDPPAPPQPHDLPPSPLREPTHHPTPIDPPTPPSPKDPPVTAEPSDRVL